MDDITLRPQRMSDAKRFYTILNNPKFTFFSSRPGSIEDERAFLRGNAARRKERKEYNFSIIHKGDVIGGCGIKFDRFREHIGEIGYFVDEKHWGKGIATESVRILEGMAFSDFGLKRLEIRVHPENKASIRVAEKCGYRKEGLLREVIEIRGQLCDSLLFAKLRTDEMGDGYNK
jgi:[ribosomal protein S5]-alanine N-acetyltransferase